QISTLLLIGVILAVIVAIIQVLIWFHTAFYLVNQTFYYETGVIIKKVHKIPLDNILGVDVQSNLRQRLFGLKYVKIDRGAKGEIEDLQLTLTTKEAQNLKNELLHTSKQAQVAVDKPLFHLNTQSLIKFAIVRNTWFNFLIAVIFIFVLNDQLQISSWLPHVPPMLFMFGSILATLVMMVGLNINKYYRFRIHQQENVLQISSGLMNKKVSSLQLEKIFAVKTTQNRLQRMNNAVTLSVSTFGYEDDGIESAVIFPYIAENQVTETIQTLFPKFSFEGDLQSISKKYKLRSQFYQIGLSPTLLFLRGGIITKKTNTILIDTIEEVTSRQNYFQKQSGLYKLKVGYKGIKFGDLSRIPGLTNTQIKAIIALVLKTK
ncbi:MAG: PH domain-containing protein, partial [Culicoidibacterales bacterium]